MNHRFEHVAALLTATLILALPNMAKAADVSGASFVAGLAPHQRPEGAPVIKDFTPDPAWRARALAAGIHGARLEIIAGAAQAPHTEAPARFNQLLDGFLAEGDEPHNGRHE